MKKDIGSTLGPICIIVVVVMFVLSMVQEGSEFKTRLENGTSTIAECEITDKYTKFTPGTKYTASVKRYFCEVIYITESNEPYKELIQTSSTFYNSVNVGEMIECEVAYDEDGVFYLKPVENIKK